MTKPIRVLQIMGKMNRGGAESMIMELYRHMDKSLIQFDFVEHTEERCCYDDEIEQMGGRIYRLPKYCGYNHFEYIAKWNALFKEHDEYQIVHCHIRSTAAVICKIAHDHGLKTIAHSHNTFNGSGLSALVKEVFQKRIVKYADYLFACSTEAGRWLFGNHVEDKNRFYLLNNAIDAKKFTFNETVRNRIRSDMGLDDCLVVGTVGRLTEQKNPLGIIEIIKELHLRKSDFRFLWIGVGDMEHIIKQSVCENGLEDIVLMLGARSDVNELMQAMDVFILPSLWEGLPVVAIEAQAAGLPCVISDTVSKEVVLTDYCKQIPVDNVTGWVHSIIEMSDEQRKDAYDIIASKNYDIALTSTSLSEFYLKLSEF